jgi:hypothetical protein
MASFNKLKAFASDAARRSPPKGLEKRDQVLDKLDSLEVDFINAVRKRLDVETLSKLEHRGSKVSLTPENEPLPAAPSTVE